MQSSPRILIVDDDLEIRRLLSRYLSGQGFKPFLAEGARELRERLKTNRPDLVVLDVMLPDGSGLDLCRELQSTHPQIPVILLTALKEDVDRIIGLEIGADDYLAKPFNPRELVARIRAVLRRTTEDVGPAAAVRYRFGAFLADPATRAVIGDSGDKVPLTSAEFDVLRAFLERPGRVLSRDQLLDIGRRKRSDPLDRSIDVLVSRIRRKLEEAGAPDAIKTIRNGGYQFVLRVENETAPS